MFCNDHCCMTLQTILLIFRDFLLWLDHIEKDSTWQSPVRLCFQSNNYIRSLNHMWQTARYNLSTSYTNVRLPDLPYFTGSPLYLHIILLYVLCHFAWKLQFLLNLPYFPLLNLATLATRLVLIWPNEEINRKWKAAQHNFIPEMTPYMLRIHWRWCDLIPGSLASKAGVLTITPQKHDKWHDVCQFQPLFSTFQKKG